MRVASLLRIFLIVVLLVAQFGLLVFFESSSSRFEAGVYPPIDSMKNNYQEYYGKNVNVAGSVIHTDPIIISYGYSPENSVELRIAGVDERVHLGDSVRVYGRVESDYTIDGKRLIKVSRTGQFYMYSISLLAGFWVLGRVIRDWKFDIKSVGFKPER